MQTESKESSEETLPAGWERKFSRDGRVFYVDHVNRTTSWTRPSLSPPRPPKPLLKPIKPAPPVQAEAVDAHAGLPVATSFSAQSVPVATASVVDMRTKLHPSVKTAQVHTPEVVRPASMSAVHPPSARTSPLPPAHRVASMSSMGGLFSTPSRKSTPSGSSSDLARWYETSNPVPYPVFPADRRGSLEVAPPTRAKASESCMRCSSKFGAFLLRHHCRCCGEIFCNKCSSQQRATPFALERKDERCCDLCCLHVDAGEWNCLLRHYVSLRDGEDPAARAKATEQLRVSLQLNRESLPYLTQKLTGGAREFLATLTVNVAPASHPFLVRSTCALLVDLFGSVAFEPKELVDFLGTNSLLKLGHLKEEQTRDAAAAALSAIIHSIDSPAFLAEFARAHKEGLMDALSARASSPAALSHIVAVVARIGRVAPAALFEIVEMGLLLVLYSNLTNHSELLRSQVVLLLTVVVDSARGNPVWSASVLPSLLSLSSGVVSSALSFVELADPHLLLYLRLLLAMALDRATHAHLIQSRVPERLDKLLVGWTSSPAYAEAVRVAIDVLSELLSCAASPARMLADSALVDVCIGLGCGQLDAAAQYAAFRVLNIAAREHLAAFRSRIAAASTVSLLVAGALSALEMIWRKEVSSDADVLFSLLGLLAFHCSVLQDVAATAGSGVDYSEAMMRMVRAGTLWRMCASSLVADDSCQTSVFLAHAIASFRDKAVREGLLRVLGDSGLIQRLLDLSSMSSKDEVMEASLLALGSLVGCSWYFSHLALHFSQIMGRAGGTRDAFSEEDSAELEVVERLSRQPAMELSAHVGVQLKKGLMSIMDNVIVPLSNGARGLGCSVSALRLMQLFCQDADFAKRIARVPGILLFASIIPTLDPLSEVIALDAYRYICVNMDTCSSELIDSLQILSQMLLSKDYLVMMKGIESVVYISANPALHESLTRTVLGVAVCYLDISRHAANVQIDSVHLVSLTLSLLINLAKTEGIALRMLSSQTTLQAVIAIIDSGYAIKTQVLPPYRRQQYSVDLQHKALLFVRSFTAYASLRGKLLETDILPLTLQLVFKISGFPVFSSPSEYVIGLEATDMFTKRSSLETILEIIEHLSSPLSQVVSAVITPKMNAVLAFVTYFAASSKSQTAIGAFGLLYKYNSLPFAAHSAPWVYILRSKLVHTCCELIAFSSFLKADEEIWLALKTSACGCLSLFLAAEDTRDMVCDKDCLTEFALSALRTLCTRSSKIFKCLSDVFFLENSPLRLTEDLVQSVLHNVSAFDEEISSLATQFLYRLIVEDEGAGRLAVLLGFLTSSSTILACSGVNEVALRRERINSLKVGDSSDENTDAFIMSGTIILTFLDSYLEDESALPQIVSQMITRMYERLLAAALMALEKSAYASAGASKINHHLWRTISWRSTQKEFLLCLMNSRAFELLLACLQKAISIMESRPSSAVSTASVIGRSDVGDAADSAIGILTSLCMHCELEMRERVNTSGVFTLAVGLCKIYPSAALLKLLLMISCFSVEHSAIIAEQEGFLALLSAQVASDASSSQANPTRFESLGVSLSLLSNVVRTLERKAFWPSICADSLKLSEFIMRDLSDLPDHLVFSALHYLRVAITALFADGFKSSGAVAAVNASATKLCIACAAVSSDLLCIDMALSLLLTLSNDSSCRALLVGKGVISQVRLTVSRLVVVVGAQAEVSLETLPLRAGASEKSLRLLQRLCVEHAGRFSGEECVLVDLMRVLVATPRSMVWLPSVLVASDVIQVLTLNRALALKFNEVMNSKQIPFAQGSMCCSVLNDMLLRVNAIVNPQKTARIGSGTYTSVPLPRDPPLKPARSTSESEALAEAVESVTNSMVDLLRYDAEPESF